MPIQPICNAVKCDPITCNPAIEIKTEYTKGYSSRRVNYIANVNHADNPLTLAAKAMVDFRVINPINYKITPAESFIGPFNFKFKPDVTLLIKDTITLRW